MDIYDFERNKKIIKELQRLYEQTGFLKAYDIKKRFPREYYDLLLEYGKKEMYNSWSIKEEYYDKFLETVSVEIKDRHEDFYNVPMLKDFIGTAMIVNKNIMEYLESQHASI